MCCLRLQLIAFARRIGRLRWSTNFLFQVTVISRFPREGSGGSSVPVRCQLSIELCLLNFGATMARSDETSRLVRATLRSGFLQDCPVTCLYLLPGWRVKIFALSRVSIDVLS